jgi:hypothetical protein
MTHLPLYSQPFSKLYIPVSHDKPRNDVVQYFVKASYQLYVILVFHPHNFPVCYKRWHKFLYDLLEERLLAYDFWYNHPIVISCEAESINLTFYPNRATFLRTFAREDRHQRVHSNYNLKLLKPITRKTLFLIINILLLLY